MADDLAPFESPKELIQGAKEQLAQLKAECAAFGDNCPYSVITRPDHKAREIVVALRLKIRLPPKIRRLTSSILKEARLALDQAMCDAAVELGRKDAKNVYFPFGKSAADLRRARIEKCKGVDRRIVAFALRFKPYYGGNPILWTMARLATYSHQRIISAKLQDTGSFAKAVHRGTGPLTLHIDQWSDFNNELVVARLPAWTEIDVRSDFVLTLKIVFAESAEAVRYREITTTLHDMIGITESIILGLEAETARLKAIPTP